MIRVMVVSALAAMMGVPSMAQAPQVPLFAFASSDAATRWQAVNDGVMGGVSDGAGPVDPRSVTSIGFLLAEKTPGPFVLEVAWVKVLRGPGR